MEELKELYGKMTESLKGLHKEVGRIAKKIDYMEDETKTAKETIEDVGNTASKAYDLVDGIDRKIEEMSRGIERSTKDMEKMGEKIDKQERKNRQTEMKVQDLDHVIRRNKIIISNLSGANGNELRDEVFRLLSMVIDNFDYNELDIVIRLGENDAQKGIWKPVLVSFLFEDTKNTIMRNKSKLNGTQGRTQFPRVWIHEDANEDVRKGMDEMQKIQRVARDIPEFRNTKIRGNVLIINGKQYSRDQLGEVPEKLRLSNICTEVGDRYIAFAGEYAPLSNMYRTKVKYQGTDFTSAEQLYCWLKAGYAKESKLQQVIKDEPNPFNCKKMVKNIRPRGWEELEETMLERSIMAKFQTSEEMANQLKATGKKILVEATRGKFWGADLTIGGMLRGKKATAIFSTNAWEGKNRMGCILMNVRGKIFEELKMKGQKMEERERVTRGEFRGETQRVFTNRREEGITQAEQTRIGRNERRELSKDETEGGILINRTEAEGGRKSTTRPDKDDGPKRDATEWERTNKEMAEEIRRDKQRILERERYFIEQLRRQNKEGREEGVEEILNELANGKGGTPREATATSGKMSTNADRGEVNREEVEGKRETTKDNTERTQRKPRDENRNTRTNSIEHAREIITAETGETHVNDKRDRKTFICDKEISIKKQGIDKKIERQVTQMC